MLTVIANNENPRTLSLPADEMEKLGINAGDEMELSKNETDEIILRSKKARNYRESKICSARTRKRTRRSEIFFPDFDEILLNHAEIIK